MSDQRNTLLAIVLAVAILFAFQTFYVNPKAEKEKARQQALSEQTGTPGGEPSAPAGRRADRPGVPAAAPGERPPIPTAPATPRRSGTAPEAPGPGGRERARAEQLRSTPRVAIDSPRLNGSISLTGGRVDDLSLADYRQDIDPKSEQIRLFSPPGSDLPYFAQFGWAPADPKIKVPGPDTPWRADTKTLTPSQPVTLSWDNGEGLRFFRTYALDDYYMFSVTQRVKNSSKSPVTLYPYGFISRTGTPETLGYFILHEGPLGVFNGTLKEIDYDDLRDSGKIVQSTQGGWIGITDKYWLAALVPDQKQSVETRFVHSATKVTDKYQVDYRGPGLTVTPGTSAEVQNHFFAGAKEVKLLDAYADYEFAGYPLGLEDPDLRRLKVQRLDLAIDFGWYFFLTKPFFYALAYFHELLGNFGLA
ncbi:MAG: membrane protein insertase YidC, partial [Proteobacteria bacterium]|nr:membrane protein insertase YidC [Pseudomonadota bacterium]